MSQSHTQTTKNTTGSSSSAETSSEKLKVPSFLEKPELDTFEEVAKFKGWYRQPSNHDKRPCFVTSELFDLLTEGDTSSPLLWMGDNKPVSVPVIDASRKTEGLEILACKKTTATIVV